MPALIRAASRVVAGRMATGARGAVATMACPSPADAINVPWSISVQVATASPRAIAVELDVRPSSLGSPMMAAPTRGTATGHPVTRAATSSESRPSPPHPLRRLSRTATPIERRFRPPSSTGESRPHQAQTSPARPVARKRPHTSTKGLTVASQPETADNRTYEALPPSPDGGVTPAGPGGRVRAGTPHWRRPASPRRQPPLGPTPRTCAGPKRLGSIHRPSSRAEPDRSSPYSVRPPRNRWSSG